jgi:hypothetical protein
MWTSKRIRLILVWLDRLIVLLKTRTLAVRVFYLKRQFHCALSS